VRSSRVPAAIELSLSAARISKDVSLFDDFRPGQQASAEIACFRENIFSLCYIQAQFASQDMTK